MLLERPTGRGTAYKLEHVGKSYPNPSGTKTLVLTEVDLTIHTGATVGIIGPSGSGKSTLLNIMGCLDSQDDGNVLIADRDVKRLSPGERASFRNSCIGFVFQLHHLLPQCTVFENVLVPTLARRKEDREKDYYERAADLIGRVGLTDRMNHRPAQLSGGECLRAAVARALINRPNILLADEPTGSLDSETSRTIADLLIEINALESVTLVAVTHSSDLAKKLATVYELRGGALHG